MLRELRRYADDPTLAIELSGYLSERQLAGALGMALEFLDGDDRGEVLDDAALLAVDLLGPGITDSQPPGATRSSAVTATGERGAM